MKRVHSVPCSHLLEEMSSVPDNHRQTRLVPLDGFCPDSELYEGPKSHRSTKSAKRWDIRPLRAVLAAIRSGGICVWAFRAKRQNARLLALRVRLGERLIFLNALRFAARRPAAQGRSSPQ